MDVASNGVDTKISGITINCGAELDERGPWSDVVTGRVIIYGMAVPVKFFWRIDYPRLKAGRRHVMISLKVGENGTLVITDLSTAGRKVEVFASS